MRKYIIKLLAVVLLSVVLYTLLAMCINNDIILEQVQNISTVKIMYSRNTRIAKLDQEDVCRLIKIIEENYIKENFVESIDDNAVVNIAFRVYINESPLLLLYSPQYKVLIFSLTWFEPKGAINNSFKGILEVGDDIDQLIARYIEQ